MAESTTNNMLEMIMPIYQLKLVARKEVANHTVEFIFERPDGFNFAPGQYGGFTLINPSETDAGGATRRFSFLSAPHDHHIAITTRIQQSAYKRVLQNLPIGSTVKFAGPTGNFTLHEDVQTPAVFIAGGIGITPFYSMLCHAAHMRSTRPITLFYGNQAPSDAAYLTELQQLQHENSNFQLVATMSQPDSVWQGETGFITYEMIKKHIPDLTTPIYYVCGSPAMVNALRETLAELDISADKIKVEDFPGY